jgi:type IV secretory pathway TraG/TraD family ATPase VirD4
MLRTLNILVLRVLYMLIYAVGGAIGVYVLISVPLVGLIFAAAWAWQRTHRPPSLSTAHGTARWAGFLDLFRNGLLGRQGLILGKVSDRERPTMAQALTALFLWRPRYSEEVVSLIRRRLGFSTESVVRLHDFSIPHLAAYGASGSGKSTSFVIPNLRIDPWSSIVLDPKGEIFKTTAHFRASQLGQKIVRIDPFDVAPSEEFPAHGFNPLSLTDNSPQAVDDARRVANALIVRNPNSNEPFWDNSAQIIIQAVIVFLLAKARAGEANLNNVRDILCSSRMMKQVSQMLRDAPEYQGLATRIGNQIRQYRGRTRTSAMSVLGTHLDFLDSIPVASVLAQSTFDPREILTTPMTIYLCLPVDRIRELAGLQRVIITSLINMIFQAGESRSRRIRFYLDEAATLAEIEALYSALLYGRSFGIRLFFLFQAASQVGLCFPQTKANDFRANVASLFCGTNDFQTAEEISQWIGQTGVHSYSRQTSQNYGYSQNGGSHPSHGTNQGYSTSVTVNETARALIRPEEVLQLSTDEAIVLLPHTRPVRVTKMPYYAATTKRRSLLGRIAEFTMLAACAAAVAMFGLALSINPRLLSPFDHTQPPAAAVDAAGQSESPPPAPGQSAPSELDRNPLDDVPRDPPLPAVVQSRRARIGVPQ